MTDDLDVIVPRLTAALEKQRVVFWEDATGEYAASIDSLTMDGATVLAVENNEFGIKSRVLSDAPKAKFVLYRASTPDGEDWLLDLKLAYGVFRADRISATLDLHALDPVKFRDIVAEHAEFFRSAKRVSALKARLAESDTPEQILAKMTAVLGGARTGHRLTEIVRVLLQEFAEDRSAFLDAITQYGLESFLWSGMERIYGYASLAPSIDDFAIWMFARANERFAPTPHPSRPNQTLDHLQLSIDFLAWRSSKPFADAYAVLSTRAAAALDIESSLGNTPVTELLDNFLYDAVDRRIIAELVKSVAAKSIPQRDVEHITRSRLAEMRNTQFQRVYEAIEAASALLADVTNLQTSLGTFAEGIDRYATTWFRIDQHYRHFHTHARHDTMDALEPLREVVESAYVIDYLYKQGLTWQQRVDAVDSWPQPSGKAASRFFRDHVKLAVGPKRKVVVIISDGLRYEVADDLRTAVRRGDKFEATISPMIGVLPSYTQLGMAALLPHDSLTLLDDAFVEIDGEPTKGLKYREKFLTPHDGKAVDAKDLLKMNREQTRELIGSCKILYVYHDSIDATGDKYATEGNVFRAAEDAITEIQEMVRKLTTEGLANIFVTADHGFQYQEEPLDEQGFLAASPKGTFVNRRFVVGRDLEPHSSVATFTAAALGLDGDVDVQIPKSTHRIVKSGAGTRYVHGGASLQEIVVPLVTINKARKSDTHEVGVQLLPDSQVITTGQLVVKLNQVDPITEKVQPRTLRIGIFAGEELISAEVERTFDLTSDDALQRLVTVPLALSRTADAHEGEVVELRLRERIGTTNHWKNYVTAQYTLKRPILSDF